MDEWTVVMWLHLEKLDQMINDLGLMGFRAKNSCLCLVSWMYYVDG